LEGSDGAAVRKRLGVVILGWKRRVSGRFIRSIGNREDEELAARVIAGSQVKVSGVLGESKFINRSVPSLRERIANAFLDIIDDDLGPIGLITIFVKFCPGDLVP